MRASIAPIGRAWIRPGPSVRCPIHVFCPAKSVLQHPVSPKSCATCNTRPDSATHNPRYSPCRWAASVMACMRVLEGDAFKLSGLSFSLLRASARSPARGQWSSTVNMGCCHQDARATSASLQARRVAAASLAVATDAQANKITEALPNLAVASASPTQGMPCWRHTASTCAASSKAP